MKKAVEQAEAKTDLQMAMHTSVDVHSEARVAVNDAEEQLTPEEAGLVAQLSTHTYPGTFKVLLNL